MHARRTNVETLLFVISLHATRTQLEILGSVIFVKKLHSWKRKSLKISGNKATWPNDRQQGVLLRSLFFAPFFHKNSRVSLLCLGNQIAWTVLQKGKAEVNAASNTGNGRMEYERHAAVDRTGNFLKFIDLIVSG